MTRLVKPGWTPEVSMRQGFRTLCTRNTWRDFFPFFYGAALVSLGLWIYWPSLSGPFLFDDTQLTEPGALAGVLNPRAGFINSRPLLMITYALNYWFTGLNPFSFHLVNVLLHCLNGLLLWRVLKALLDRPTLASLVSPTWRSLIVHGMPLLFIASPIQTESVAYISSRSELLAAMFYLLALRVFVSPWKENRTWIAAGLIGFLYACSVSSKQHALSLPLAILLLDRLLLSRDGDQTKQTLPIYSVLMAELLLGAIVVARSMIAAPTAGFFLASVKWPDYLFTQFRVYFLYLRLLAVPFGLNADYDIVLSQSLWDRLSWLALSGLIALVVAAVSCRKRLPLASFGTLFFLLTLAPSSSFFPLLDYAAERRLYLPSIGFFLAALALAAAIWHSTRKLPWIALGLILIAYSAGTFERSRVWADNLTLWQDTANKSPLKYRPHNNLGVEYIRRQRYADAAEAFARAEQLVPPGSAAHAHILNNLGLSYANRGMYARAIEYYENAIRIVDAAEFRANLAIAQARLAKQE
jgi:tetratricopeptide (TPR) repeat protein